MKSHFIQQNQIIKSTDILNVYHQRVGVLLFVLLLLKASINISYAQEIVTPEVPIAETPTPNTSKIPATSPSDAADEGDITILQAQVNQIRKGDVFLWIDADEQVWLRSEDLSKLGLQVTAKELKNKQVQGQKFSLLKVSGLEAAIDYDQLILKVQAEPKLLGKQVIDLSNGEHHTLSKQPWLSAYLNHDWGIGQASSSGFSWSGDLRGSLALGPLVVQSAHTIASQTRSETVQSSVLHKRQSTQAFIDSPSIRTRLSYGDILSNGGLSSAAGAMLGVQIARRFALDPYAPQYPTFDYLASIDTPSTAELSINGQKIKTIKLKPGMVDLRNFSYFAGLQQMQLLITDAAGVQKTIQMPFYFSNTNLKAGVQDYSYSYGHLREASASYGEPWQYQKESSMVGMHRIGVTNWLSIGVQGEKLPQHKQWGGNVGLVLGRLGNLNLSQVRRSHFDDTLPKDQTYGTLNQALYQLNTKGFNFSLGYIKQSPYLMNWERTAELTTNPSLKNSTNVSVSTMITPAQSVVLNWSLQRYYNQTQSRWISLSHRYSISKQWQMSSFIQQQNNRLPNSPNATDISWTTGIQVSYRPSSSWGYNSTYEQKENSKTLRLSAQRDANKAHPWSTRLGATLGQSRNDSGNTNVQAMDAASSYQSEYGDIAAYLHSEHSAQTWQHYAQARVTGAIAYADSELYFGRPIDQSFAILNAANTENVRVYRNNQLVGRTNASGRLIIPSISAYVGQQIRIDDRDVPLNTQLEQVQQYAVARDGAAAQLNFKGKEQSSISGYLSTLQLVVPAAVPVPVELAPSPPQTKSVKLAKQSEPIVFEAPAEPVLQTVRVAQAQLIVSDGAQERKTSTGPDGDFYLEDLEPNKTYTLKALNRKISCTAEYKFSAPYQAWQDIGELKCVSDTPVAQTAPTIEREPATPAAAAKSTQP